MLGGLGSLIFIVNNPKPLTIVGGLVFLLGSVAMGAAMFTTQRSAAIRSVRRNRADYLAHVEQARADIRAAARAQDAAEAFRHPGPAQLLAVAMDPTRRYERRPVDEDFLDVRVGTGAVAYRAPLQARLGAAPGVRRDVVCVAAARRLTEDHAVLHDQPLTVDLAAAGVVSFVGDRHAAREACAALLLSLACLHAPEEVTIAACIAPPVMKRWQWLRWLPHARDRPTARRFLAATIPELEALLAEHLNVTPTGRRDRPGAGAQRRLIVLVDTEALSPGVHFPL